ncbi:MAG: MazG nucleotide pyrophosphohydrolase domain-containing protein [Candidatus Bathyarchaeia archaeon]
MKISDFQLLMLKTYYEKDSKRGIDGSLHRLREEVDELEKAIIDGSQKAIEEELADVLAWVASISNILCIDLQKAASEKYGEGCPRCKASPCKCEDDF